MSTVARRNNVNISGNPNGRTILFSHGFGCNQDVWRHVAPAFLEDYRVVLFDLTGAGASDLSAYDRAKYDSLDGYADDVIEILEDLDAKDAIFVGHSVSSMIGVLAANRDPSRVGTLVLVGPSARYINDGGYVGGFEEADIMALLDDLDANYLGWSSAMAPAIMGNPDRPELGEELTGNFCSTDPEIARHFARVTFLSDNRRDLAEVSVPTLVLQCSDDLIAPASAGRYVHEHIRDSTFVNLSATGHIPNLSNPAELSEAILGFLR
ncbi:alpha/beta fold hydrolase [Salinibacterium sp. GXW1014]|uniref:alpha/beta fold hydrolase n=1 Tax=Salinibacterium sp. GXW1014 TaxID=3377838 RepID=UPI003839DF2F